MDELFKDKYQPGSSRLQGWDYSLSGTYFITICTKNREEFFGEVVDDEMILSKEGGIVEKYWKEITKHFANVRLDEFIVMPNHLHGIIVIENVETSIYGVSKSNVDKKNNDRDAINRRLYQNKYDGGITNDKNPMLSKNSLGKIIRWYKGRSTFEIRKSKNPNFFWQPRYYDRIIRNDEELNRICEYIQYNPYKWGSDRNNLENLYI